MCVSTSCPAALCRGSAGLSEEFHRRLAFRVFAKLKGQISCGLFAVAPWPGPLGLPESYSHGSSSASSWKTLHHRVSSSHSLLASSLPVRFSSASWNFVKRLHLRSYGKAHCGGSLCARYEQFSILTWSHSAKSSAARCFICGCSLHGRRCPRGKDVTRVSCSLSWVGWSLSWVGGSVRGVSQETCV